jgi:hypothetical protein
VIWAEAELMYNGMVGPQWSILGEATKGLWYGKAKRKLEGVQDWWSYKHDR